MPLIPGTRGDVATTQSSRYLPPVPSHSPPTAAILKASSPEFNSRLVQVGSSGHPAAEIQFDDFNLAADGAYDPSKAYEQSKLAQIYAANYKHMTKSAKQSWTENDQLTKWLKSPEQGAATAVLASLSSYKRRKWPR
ncbi:putative Short chain dehydrogenase [Seiridium cardinale]